jgi:hypothetical protein
MSIRRIVSGAQTGVDRAALDAALESGIPCGGWVPKGRLDENGVIPSRYPNLTEAESPKPNVRTELNVRDSDATLIFTHGPLFGGSAYTAQIATELQKPFLHIDLNVISDHDAVDRITAWLGQIQPEVLNVAGPRHSTDNLIYLQAKLILLSVMSCQRSD